MCGTGDKADHRPVDPPPIVQLRVHDRLKSEIAEGKGKETDKDGSKSKEKDKERDKSAALLLQNPYYFCWATLCKADDNEELYSLANTKTRVSPATSFLSRPGPHRS